MINYLHVHAAPDNIYNFKSRTAIKQWKTMMVLFLVAVRPPDDALVMELSNTTSLLRRLLSADLKKKTSKHLTLLPE